MQSQDPYAQGHRDGYREGKADGIEQTTFQAAEAMRIMRDYFLKDAIDPDKTPEVRLYAVQALGDLFGANIDVKIELTDENHDTLDVKVTN